MSVIRVALVGVGNCASSLVQGVEYYRATEDTRGLIHATVGPYTPGDLEFVAAFDVDRNKVGKPLKEAIFAPPNNTLRLWPTVNHGPWVDQGPVLDGIGHYVADVVVPNEDPPVNVAQILADRKVDVLVNYLPVGSQKATEYYMTEALRARVAVVNCIPVFIASDPTWAERFRKASVSIVGDDVKSQVGATIVHRTLVDLCKRRGIEVLETYQLNVGGNTDFLNMLERSRLESKKISKTQSVTSQLGTPLPADKVHIGPSDHVPWLLDQKLAFIRVNGLGFGGAPMNIEVRMEVWDSPNSAGVVLDAIRCAKLAMDRDMFGPVQTPCSALMKSPPHQLSDAEASIRLDEYVR